MRAFCGGEALSGDLADKLAGRVAELWNLYGPTETTIWSTAGRVGSGKAPISIGRPIENTRVYIVDQESELVPIGVPGEILIAGEGVAAGYHRRPELTAERFGIDKFGEGDQRLYRTGDLGKWGPEGQLYHLGRIDSQVKVRGFRIETGEIEMTLRKHPAVMRALVVATELNPGDSRLVAYIVSRENIVASEIRNFLRLSLPDYMIPSVIVSIDTIPLTPSGKIDRTALPNPFANDQNQANEFIAPSGSVEAMIAGIWQELLDIKSVSANDNFFELGGHSLLAVRVSALVQKRTGQRLDPRRLFFQTLRQIAGSLAERQDLVS